MAHTTLLDLHISPDDIPEAHRVMHETLVQTRARKGCLGLQVYTDVTDPTHVVFIESWESAEDVAAYRAWRATPEGASGLGSVLTAPPVLTDLALEPEI